MDTLRDKMHGGTLAVRTNGVEAAAVMLRHLNHSPHVRSADRRVRRAHRAVVAIRCLARTGGPERSKGVHFRMARLYPGIPPATQELSLRHDVALRLRCLAGDEHAGRICVPDAHVALAEEAAFAARETGLRLELVFVMNDSPPAHLDLARRYACAVYDDIVIVEVSRASLGGARQDGLKVARGEYICFADDDDLVSSNTIVRFHHRARQAGSRSIVVPQYLVTFGHQNYVAEYQSSDVVSPLAWLKYHPFISRIFLHASAIECLHYADVAPGGGYAYEDWHFNAGAIAQDYHFVSAPGTILFYRQRPAGLLAQFNAGAVRQIPPSPLFHPDIYLRICGKAVATFDGNFPLVDFDAVRRGFTDDPDCRVATFAANQIDPTVDWARICSGTAWVNWFGDRRPGAAYYRACEIVRGLTFDHVVLCQSVSEPAAARRVRFLVDAVRTSQRDARFLVLAAEGTASEVHEIAGTTTLHLGALYPGLSEEDGDVVALRIVENTAARSRLHLFGGPFARRFYLLYRRILSTSRAIYYRDEDRVRFDDHLPAVEAPDLAFLSEVLAGLSLVVSDCLHGMRRDRACFGVHQDRWVCLYGLPPAETQVAPVQRADGKRRFLWITGDDDPNAAALVALVEEALSSNGITAELTILKSTGRADSRDDGWLAFCDGVIHTAFTENLPIVVLDALAAGVPVIGMASGGIGEAVVDNQTGWLIPLSAAVEAADLLFDAITQCRRGPKLTHRDRPVPCKGRPRCDGRESRRYWLSHSMLRSGKGDPTSTNPASIRCFARPLRAVPDRDYESAEPRPFSGHRADVGRTGLLDKRGVAGRRDGFVVRRWESV